MRGRDVFLKKHTQCWVYGRSGHCVLGASWLSSSACRLQSALATATETGTDERSSGSSSSRGPPQDAVGKAQEVPQTASD